MKNKYILLVAVLIVGAILITFIRKPVVGEEIRIGAVVSTSGDAAADGLNIKRGIDLAVADLAKKGVKVSVEYQDDQTDATKAVSAVQYLLSTFKPQVIVGPTWSFLEDATGPVIAGAKIVAYAPANTSEYTSAISPYNFRGAPLNALAVGPMAEWLQVNNKSRVAIIYDKSPWGESVGKSFRDAVTRAGKTIVLEETTVPFGPDAASVTSLFLAKAKALNADVILWTGYDPEAVALVRKRAELNYNVPVIAQTTAYQALLSRKAVDPKEVNNMFYLAIPRSQEFVEKFEAAYGEEPGNYADRAYDGVMLLVEALQNSPTNDSDAISSYLHTKLKYQGYAGTYEFNENGDVKSGKWVILPIVE